MLPREAVRQSRNEQPDHRPGGQVLPHSRKATAGRGQRHKRDGEHAQEADKGTAHVPGTRPGGDPDQEPDATSTDNRWNFLIHSPINGRVLCVFQESTAVVTAGTPLLELGDPDDLEIVVDVLSQDAVAIEQHDRVILEHWGGDRPLEGRVRLIEPAGFTKVSTLGVEEQRVNVVIDLVDPPKERQSLGDGFRVEARIVVWESKNVLKVPTSARFRHDDDWAVFRVVNGTAKRTIVKLGKQNGLEAEVLDGLEEGDTVIVHPSDSVRDGAQVRPR